MSQVARCRRNFGSYISTGWHNVDMRSWPTFAAQIVSKRVAGDEKTSHVAIRPPVERCLHRRAQEAMVDAAWGLVQHASYGSIDVHECHESRGDAVEHHHVRTQLFQGAGNTPSVHKPEWKRALRNGDKLDPRGVCGCQLGETPMKQVPAGQRAGVAQRYQSG
jgi:hypothetical protein